MRRIVQSNGFVTKVNVAWYWNHLTMNVIPSCGNNSYLSMTLQYIYKIKTCYSGTNIYIQQFQMHFMLINTAVEFQICYSGVVTQHWDLLFRCHSTNSTSKITVIGIITPLAPCLAIASYFNFTINLKAQNIEEISDIIKQ